MLVLNIQLILNTLYEAQERPAWLVELGFPPLDECDGGLVTLNRTVMCRLVWLWQWLCLLIAATVLHVCAAAEVLGLSAAGNMLNSKKHHEKSDIHEFIALVAARVHANFFFVALIAIYLMGVLYYSIAHLICVLIAIAAMSFPDKARPIWHGILGYVSLLVAVLYLLQVVALQRTPPWFPRSCRSQLHRNMQKAVACCPGCTPSFMAVEVCCLLHAARQQLSTVYWWLCIRTTLAGCSLLGSTSMSTAPEQRKY